MTEQLQCYRCGESLAALSLPLSRRDLCPSCGNELHVCRMCQSYDPAVAEQCREDDAEEVKDKEKANFCDWFEPVGGRFDATARNSAEQAEQRLAALFGGSDAEDDDDDALKAAEDLFR